MQVHVEFAAQLRDVAGASRQTLTVSDECANVGALLKQLAEEHGDDLRKILMDENGQMSHWILVDLEGVMIRDQTTPLSDGNTLRLLSPISGG